MMQIMHLVTSSALSESRNHADFGSGGGIWTPGGSRGRRFKSCQPERFCVHPRAWYNVNHGLTQPTARHSPSDVMPAT